MRTEATQRDDFSEAVKRALAARVGNLCSNPDCHALTSGPHEAAHMTAAAPGGPRYDASLTPEQRSSIENAIWLCQNCAALIDSDPVRFPMALLREWKAQAEEAARSGMGKTAVAPSTPAGPASYDQNLQGVIAGAVVSGPGGQAHGTVNIGQVVARSLQVPLAEPKLRLVFSERLTDRFTLSLRPLLPSRDAFIATEMEKVREANPRDGIRVSSRRLLEDGSWSEEHVTEPDADLDDFLAKYEAYLGKLYEYRERENRIVRFNLTLLNEGRLPAEEVDVTLFFPRDVEVWAQTDKARNLQMPEKPQRDEFLVADKLMRSLKELKEEEARGRAIVARMHAGPPNVSKAAFRRTPVGTEVQVAAQRIKHDRQPVEVAPLCVMFPSRESMGTFAIGYRVFALNVPDLIEGQLTIMVDNSTMGSATFGDGAMSNGKADSSRVVDTGPQAAVGREATRPAPLVVLGAQIVAEGRRIAAAGNRWTLQLSQFLIGDESALCQFAEQVERLPLHERFVVVSDPDDARLLEGPLSWQADHGVVRVEVTVAAARPRCPVAEVGTIDLDSMDDIQGMSAAIQELRYSLASPMGGLAVPEGMGTWIGEWIQSLAATERLNDLVRLELVRRASVPRMHALLGEEHVSLAFVERVVSVHARPDEADDETFPADVEVVLVGAGPWRGEILVARQPADPEMHEKMMKELLARVSGV